MATQGGDVVLQSDGKILIGGWFDNSGNNQGDDSLVVRLNPDGNPDPLFGTNGYAAVSMVGFSTDVFYALAVQPDGKIVVAGTGNGIDVSVARFFSNPDQALVAHYPFDGDANDASTQGNNPTTVNATLTTNRRGNTDTTYDFNGVDNSIVVPDSPSLDITDAITLAAWIRPRQANGSYVVLKRTDNGGGVYSLDIYPGSVRAVLDNVPQVNGTSAIQANQWQHIAMTWDGTTVTVYYNGVAENNTAYAGPIPTSNGDLEIGVYSGGAPIPYFDGAIDDVRIYNRALSNTEIQSLMQTWHVDSTGGDDANDGLSWASPKQTIRAAIDVAVPEDDIWVRTGTYAITSPIKLNKAVRMIGGLIGSEGTEFFDTILTRTNITTPSVIDGGFSVYHCVLITASTTLDGFTITGGYANGTDVGDKYGGGIRAQSGNSIIRNCYVLGNYAESGGAGISLSAGNTVSHCNITGNDSDYYGGGIYFSGASLVEDSLITANSSLEFGGGIYIGNNNSIVTGSTITANISFNDGGGIYINNFAPTIENSVIFNNSATNEGGGIASISSDAVIKESVIAYNDSSSGNGGGVSMEGTSGDYDHTVLTNCVISSNTSFLGGGGIYDYRYASPDLINCTVAQNNAGTYGGGLWVNPQNSAPAVFNSIVWGNTATSGAPQIYFSNSDTFELVVGYSDVTPDGWWEVSTFNVGNINADPMFVDADGPDNDPDTWADNNLRLTPASPVIDTGAASFASAGLTAPTIDIEQTLRPQDFGFDMGAFEYTPGSAWMQTNVPGFGDPLNYSTYRLISIGAGGAAGLYAGIWGDNGALVYKYDSGTGSWFDTGVTGAPGWATYDPIYFTGNSGINSMVEYGGNLYIGTYNGSDGSQAWSYDGSTWSQVNLNGFGSAGPNPSNYSADSMAVYGGNLYTSVANVSGVGVYRYDGGTTWTQVNTSGFGIANNYRSHAMIEHGGFLYVGTENFNGATLFQYTGSGWNQITIDGFGDTNNTVFRSMAVYDGDLYVAALNDVTGVEIWRFKDASWSQVNTDGFGMANNTQAKAMIEYEGELYVGTDNDMDGAELWKYDGASWTLVKDAGLGNINNLYVNSLAVFDSRLYIGTYNDADGTEIWASEQAFAPTLTFDASVMHLVGSDGSSNTLLSAIITDFSGTLPDDIDSISVERDGNDMGLTKSDFGFNSQFNQFNAVIPDPPVPGTYTFTITAGATSVSSADIQEGAILYLPSPGVASLYPFDGLTVYRSTPTFSWQPLYYPITTLYYRLEVALDDGGAPGDQVYATGRTTEMYHHTLPGGTLNPGQTYWWRVRVTDADSFIGTHNRRNTSWRQFTMAPSVPVFSKAPGITDDEVGVTTFNIGTQVYLYFWVKVVDHEGIPEGGTSHQVKVAFPAGSPAAGGELMLYFDGGENYDGSLHGGLGGYRVGYYETLLVSLQDTDPAPWAGDYLFTVTDAEENSYGFIDTLNVAVLDQPDETSVTVNGNNNLDESITATFDNVYVNGGSPYDDFSGYATIDDAIASGKWTGYGGDGDVSIVGEQVQITSPAKVGRSHTQLTFTPLNPSFHSVQADITVTAATSNGAPRARVWDTIYNNGTNDVYVVVNVHSDRVTYHINERIVSGNTVGWNIIDMGDLLTGISIGTTVPVMIDWDGSTLDLYADNLVTPAATFAPGGTVNLPASPSTSLQARLQFTTPVTPAIGWDPVTGANTYRAMVYNNDSSQVIWSGKTGGTSIRVPPGKLEPNSFYRLRVDARDAHLGLDRDNMSRTPTSYNDYYVFFTDSNPAVDPMIKFDRGGVYTWNNEYFGPLLAFHTKVFDVQGVPGNIKQVKVTWDDGGTPREEILYYDDDPYFGPTPTSGVYRNFSFYPAVATTYTFTAEDWDGNTHTTTEDLTVNPIGISDYASLVPSGIALEIPVMDGTGVNFNWADVTGATNYVIEIYNKYGSRLFGFTTTQSQFDLAPGFLEEGNLYHYQIHARREYLEDNVDNGSSSPFDDIRMPTFMTTSLTGGSAAPVIDPNSELVTVVHFDIPAMGGSVYELGFEVKITDVDGVPENIRSVVVTFPDGTTKQRLLLDYVSGPTQGEYWGNVIGSDPSDPATIQEGTYTITVTDFDGNTDTYTDEFFKNILPVPTGLRPVNDSTVAGTTPTIDWADVPGAVKYMVEIENSSGSGVLDSPALTESFYVVPGGNLDLNSTYQYRVTAFAEDPDVLPDIFDNASESMPFGDAMPHFTPLAFVDSDTDGMDDNWEQAQFGNLGQDAASDFDSDGLLDVNEYINSSDPTVGDTDGDGMPDGWEATYGLILLSDDSGADPDSDLRSNIQEYLDGTDPTVADVAAPTNLVAGTQTDSTVALSWTAITPVGGTGSYEVYYATVVDGPYTLFGTTADETVESITVTGLMPFTVYYFKLRTVLPGPLYSDYTAEVSQGTLSPPPTPAPFAPSQVAGTWRMHNLRSGDAPQVTGWMHGDLILDAAGNGTFSSIDSDGYADSGPVSTRYTEHGLFMEPVPGFSNQHGVISSDRQMMVFTENNQSGGYELSVILKQDPAVTYSASDFAGDWYALFLTSGDAPQGTGWWRGLLSFDASGNFTGSGLHYDGSTNPQSGTLEITSTGLITQPAEPSLDFNGVMNITKDLMVFTFNDGGGGYDLCMMLKRNPSTSFYPDDMLGTWYGHDLTSGDGPTQEPGWSYRTLIFNPDGTIDHLGGSNHNGQSSPGTLTNTWSVDTNGVVTDSSNASAYGALSNDKNLLVMTYTDFPKDQPVISVYVKKFDDTDADGMEDGWEWVWFGNLDQDNTTDFDLDWLLDVDEYTLGTDPTDPDSDGDGMPDGWEVSYLLDPLTDDAGLDADSDGLTNGDEYAEFTDPTNSDTDWDGLSDGEEVHTHGTEPRLDDTDSD
ncbi:LamG-like jellyroll fold domain-containing protein, partial [Thermodesulfobacteriota bacterium]